MRTESSMSGTRSAVNGDRGLSSRVAVIGMRHA